MPLGTKTTLPSVQLDAVREDLHDATQGTILAATAETFALVDAQTLLVDVDAGGVQVVVFNAVDFDDISLATAAEVAAIIAAALTGASAADDGGAPRITSDAWGVTSSVEVTGGTAAAAFAFPGGAQAGTDATPITRLINRIPEDTETGVPVESNVELEIHDTTGEAGITDVEVQIDGTLAYDADGGGFQAGYSGTVTTPDANTRRIVINPAIDLDPDVLVTVQVDTTGGSTPLVASTYTFNTEDVVQPTAASAVAQEKKIVRVTFDEAVLQVSPSGASDALNPGNYSFVAGGSPAVSVVPVEVVPVSAVAVDVETDIELSFGVLYTVTVSNVADLLGNVITPPSNSSDFVAFTPNVPDGRRFELIEFIPQINRTEDATGELATFIAINQDVVNLLLCEIDRFATIIDPDLAPDDFLDAMLCDLGNPFSFALLSPVDKRRLLRILVDIYKQKGTEAGIINVINFFLGVLVTIDVFNGEGWELASSDLPTLDGQSPPAGPGDELSSAATEPADAASLGPGEQRLLYSFIVVSPVDLTTDQRDRITQIVDLMKPAHTHLIGIAEPATAPLPTDHLELGVSELGSGSPGTWTLH